MTGEEVARLTRFTNTHNRAGCRGANRMTHAVHRCALQGTSDTVSRVTKQGRSDKRGTSASLNPRWQWKMHVAANKDGIGKGIMHVTSNKDYMKSRGPPPG